MVCGLSDIASDIMFLAIIKSVPIHRIIVISLNCAYACTSRRMYRQFSRSQTSLPNNSDDSVSSIQRNISKAPKGNGIGATGSKNPRAY